MAPSPNASRAGPAIRGPTPFRCARSAASMPSHAADAAPPCRRSIRRTRRTPMRSGPACPRPSRRRMRSSVPTWTAHRRPTRSRARTSCLAAVSPSRLQPACRWNSSRSDPAPGSTSVSTATATTSASAGGAPTTRRSASRRAGRAPLQTLPTPLTVLDRAGCDLRPIDPAAPADRERLLSYIWPDQSERLARAEAALSLAAKSGTRVERADAGDWLAARLAAPASPHRARVVFHTIVWPYLPEATKTRLKTVIADAGARATADAPLAWLRMEPDEVDGSAAIHVTIWPSGEVADARPHGFSRSLDKLDDRRRLSRRPNCIPPAELPPRRHRQMAAAAWQGRKAPARPAHRPP